ncbi:MAG: hypothetical protein BWY53_00513 [Parcubacteria group bacterium ADurb.Bin326]|nr:MAG: hypothetical protein BWY53_00513 [Parcubacteria group bacterium ADurb.Bin326]
MKKILSYTLFSLLLFISVPFIAHASDSQSITLNPGWNVVSVPKLVSSHQFSAADKNFDIKLLEAGKWKTMSQMNQGEFQPLFGYFIKNKTKTNQTLTLDYRTDVTADQAKFTRQIEDGINVIGIANPQYALKQSDPNSGKDNAGNILGDTNKCVLALFDFTYTNPDDSSVKISQGWLLKNLFSFKKIKDLKETKAYGVWLKKDCQYNGYQEPSSIAITSELTVSSNSDYQNILAVPGTVNIKIGEYLLTASSSEDLKATSLKLNFLSGHNNVKNIRLASGDVTLGVVNSLSSSSTNYYFFSLIIPKGQSKTVSVYADISSNATGTIQTQIYSQDDINVLGVNSLEYANVLGTPVIGQMVSIVNPQVIAAQGHIVNRLIPSGLSDVNLINLSLHAKNGNIKINKLTFKSDNPSIVLDNFRLFVGTTVISSGGEYNFSDSVMFNGLNLIVPDNTVLNLRLVADSLPINFISGESFRFDFDPTSFSAIEASSGNSVGIYEASSTIIGNQITIRKSTPIISTSQQSSVLINGNNDLIRFNVVADAAGSIAWKKITLNYQTSGNLDTSNFRLYSLSDGYSLTDANITVQPNGDIIVELPNEDYISAGTYKTYILSAMVNDVITGSAVSTQVKGSIGNPGTASAYDSSIDNFVWSDLSASDHSLTSSDWCDANYVKGLPSDSYVLNN